MKKAPQTQLNLVQKLQDIHIYGNILFFVKHNIKNEQRQKEETMYRKAPRADKRQQVDMYRKAIDRGHDARSARKDNTNNDWKHLLPRAR